MDAELLRRAAKPPRILPDRALAFLLVNKLSKAQYENVRSLLKEVDLLDVVPAYNHVREAKPKCIPEGLKVTETECTVPLASLLQHTSRRILESKSESELEALDSHLTLVAKWGCDGSSGHSKYKQNFGVEGCSDENLFLTSMVPLQIYCGDDESKCVWLSPRPASTRLCRLMRFQCVKESKAVIVSEVSRVQDEISNLKRTEVVVNDRSFFFEYRLIFSMIDGKVLNHVNDVPSMAVCSICKASPSEMNRLELVYAKPVNACHMSMSPLHARIKMMECLLKISYNLPLHPDPDPAKALWGKKLTPEQAALKKQTKQNIQLK